MNSCMHKTPHLIVLSLHQQRAAEGKQTGRQLAHHHTRSVFGQVVGHMLVCFHTVCHHTAMLQFSGQFKLCAICSRDGISAAGTNVSEHSDSDLQVNASGLSGVKPGLRHGL